ncbi:MAG TPA: threonine synthase, partial [Negativicutes bacterium]
MSFVQGLVCVKCGRTYTPQEADYYCPACGYDDGILNVQYDYDAVERELNPNTLFKFTERSMWRYLPL